MYAKLGKLSPTSLCKISNSLPTSILSMFFSFLLSSRCVDLSQSRSIPFHFISFHFISFHFISFHFISFHFISFHFISFHFISFNPCLLLFSCSYTPDSTDCPTLSFFFCFSFVRAFLISEKKGFGRFGPRSVAAVCIHVSVPPLPASVAVDCCSVVRVVLLVFLVVLIFFLFYFFSSSSSLFLHLLVVVAGVHVESTCLCSNERICV